ncbi:MAG: ABC transporter substrate-binding protein [Clostridiales Family XIII bacterium]|jgi:iron complex transport system substrate-binding protein|nr:ABC transporter substrate-binding protein [Clostridiales Family XIII bacterium]
MKKKLILAAAFLLLAATLLPAFTGCATGTSGSAGAGNTGGETQEFTDSAGRTVTLPAAIDTIAPSGAYAQVFLYTLCPEKLIGLSGPFSRKQKEYVDEAYWSLPVFGQFYGKNATMNFEEIIKAAPDVIIDVGEVKDGIGADMDGVQAQTGIPVIFVEATLRSMADAYDALGGVLGVQERAADLSGYVRDVLAVADENNAKIPAGEQLRVLFGGGEYGLNVSGAGSVHAEVLDAAGAENVAVLGHVSDSGGDEVSVEQVLLWDPDVVILAPDSNYGDIFKDSVWADVAAVRRGTVYEVPSGPYSWLDRPPSVQRALGVLWLGNLLYPNLYDFDMAKKTTEFFRLFWNYGLSEEAAREMLENSTYRTNP